MHACNVEMVLRMGEALQRAVVGEDADDVWVHVSFCAPEEEAGPSPRSGPG